MKTIYAYTGQSPAVGYVGYINVRQHVSGIAFTVRSEGEGNQGEIILTPEQCEHLAVDLLAHLEGEPGVIANLTAERDALRAKVAAMESQDRALRRLFCASVADRPYMDDGEAHDGSTHPFIDYLRDSVDEIRCKRQERALKSLAPGAAPQQWQTIETAPKDGSLIVVRGNHYGDSEKGQHHCIATWHNGYWMEASDWNPTSELEFLTHWMPLPAAPKCEHGFPLTSLCGACDVAQAAPAQWMKDVLATGVAVTVGGVPVDPFSIYKEAAPAAQRLSAAEVNKCCEESLCNSIDMLNLRLFDFARAIEVAFAEKNGITLEQQA